MKIVKKIIDVFLTIIIVVSFAFIGLYLLKITPYVVLSPSMSPGIKTGDLVFINRNFKYEDVEVKDIIAFKKENTLVTHRVVEITDDGLVTKGDANQVNDEGAVKKEQFVGRNVFNIPKLGYAVRVIQTTNGKIISISIIIMLFVFSFIVDKPKKEIKENKEVKEIE